MPPALPINEKPFYNTDQITNAIASNDMWDCIMEVVPGVGNVTRRRPALKDFTDLGTGAQGDGLFWWDDKQQLIAVSGGRTFIVNQDGTTTDITGATLNAGVPVVFAPGADRTNTPWLYLANGKLAFLRNRTAADAAKSEALVADATTVYNGMVAVHAAFTAALTDLLNLVSAVNIAAGVTTTEIGALTAAVNAAQTNYNLQLALWRLNANVYTYAAVIQAQNQLSAARAALVAAETTSPDSVATAAATLSTAIDAITAPLTTLRAAVSTAAENIKDGLALAIDNVVSELNLLITIAMSLLNQIDAGILVMKDAVTQAEITPLTSAIAKKVQQDYSDANNYEGFTGTDGTLPAIGTIANLMSRALAAKNGVFAISAGLATAAPTDIDTPDATHVGWVDEKFVANKPGTNQFLFTDFDDNTGYFNNTFWSGTNNPVVCNAKGQKIIALMVAWSQVYAWGTLGCQIFQDDGTTPFVNIPGAFIEAGLEAPYSVKRGDNAIFALCVIDDKRVVVLLVGSTPRVVSEPIASVLAEMPTVSDAIGDLVSVGGLALYVLQFPSAGQTWVYDYKNDVWFRWGAWDALAAEHVNFLGQHACFVKAWNKHLIMSRVDGKIYELDRKTYSDADRQLVSYRRTGWIDHGMVWNRKRSNQFYLKVKVFARDSVTTPTLLMRWRDDGKPQWSNYLELRLDPDSQGDCLIKLNRMGMYRTRQYEFRISDGVDLALIGATEDVKELRN